VFSVEKMEHFHSKWQLPLNKSKHCVIKQVSG